MICSKTNIEKINSPIKSNLSILSQNGSQSKIQIQHNVSTYAQQSMHTIPRKLSPKPKSHFRQISNLNNKLFHSKQQNAKIIPINGILKSGSSPNKHMIMTSPTKSIQYSNDQNQLTNSANSKIRYLPTTNNIENNKNSIIKIVQNQLTKNVKINYQPSQGTLRSPNKSVLVSPQKIIIRCQNSPSKINKKSANKIQNSFTFPSVQINHPVKEEIILSQKQSQLLRRVKFLECRIAELYQQKQQLQFRLNEENIKLQYQNKHLLTQLEHSIRQKSKYRFSESQDDTQRRCTSQNCKCKDADAMLKQLGKSQQNEYHQSKEIHSLKASLNEVEDMLSKQIDKSLQLLQQLQNKDKFYSQQKTELQNLKKRNHELQIENESFAKKIQEFNQLFLEINQNKEKNLNELLQKQIKQLRNKLSLQQSASKKNLQDLQQQMTQIEARNSQIIKYYQQKVEQYMMKIENLQSQIQKHHSQMKEMKSNFGLLAELQENNNKLVQELKSFKQEKSNLQNALLKIQKNKEFQNKQIQQFTQTILQMNRQILAKEGLINDFKLQNNHKEQALKELKKRTEELVIQLEQSLAREEKLKMTQSNGFSKGNTTLQSNNCQKCQQLRKTIFKLNNHLNRSSYTSQSLIQSKVSCKN